MEQAYLEQIFQEKEKELNEIHYTSHQALLCDS
jgi:hypothetical protein